MLADWALSDRAQPAARERAREADTLLRSCLATRVAETNTSRLKLADTKVAWAGAVLSLAVCDPAAERGSTPGPVQGGEGLLTSAMELLQLETSISPSYVRDSLQRLILLYEAWKSSRPKADTKRKPPAGRNGWMRSSRLRR
jgi:hypothetical protein